MELLGFCEETLKLSWLTCSHETSHAFTTSAKTNLGETGGSAQGAGKERGNFLSVIVKMAMYAELDSQLHARFPCTDHM